MELAPRKRFETYELLRRDVQFLQGLGVMDYSLLVGIHYCQNRYA